MKILTFFFLCCCALTSSLKAFSFESQGKAPLEITAQNGMICSQDKKRCTALGPVVSTKGNSVLKSEKLVVYFKNESSSKVEKSDENPRQDVERIEAIGNVHFFDTGGTKQGGVEAKGDYALYQEEKGKLILEGNPILRDAQTLISGGAQVIFYEKAQMAKTVGRSTVKREDKLMQADVFNVYFTKDATGKFSFDRVEAHGNVLISTPTEIAKAKRGVYANTTQVAELFDDVVITRVEGQLRGNYGRYDMASGQSQLFQDQDTREPGKQVQAILSPKILKRTKVKKKTT
ncbi:MAG: hypothetical protein GW748_01250 [Alphaproteobacteria bacterium]|nr:hypothetical protein [Alphaproteobacteria bacterium]NCQ66360.1 hypothetical protein [Alphaproteobacteria bacterium]NCT06846.1 hypothetical protein [Alphaproteobacteria bacterium]